MEQKLVKETFFKFFTTALASSVTLSVLSMTDLMIAGNVVGEKGLAAVSLALPVVILVQIASALWGTGGAIVFSARLGEGDLPGLPGAFSPSLWREPLQAASFSEPGGCSFCVLWYPFSGLRTERNFIWPPSMWGCAGRHARDDPVAGPDHLPAQ